MDCNVRSAVDAASTYWMTFASNFGWVPRDVDSTSGRSNNDDAFRVFVVVMLFSGNIVFMAYIASLTVALSIVRPKLPFNSLEGLLESPYRSRFPSSMKRVS